MPYGYRAKRVAVHEGSSRTRLGTMLAIEPSEAATVAMVFAWRTDDHLGCVEIARRLSAVRYPRPVHPVDGREVVWTGRLVAAMLTHPVYSGRSVWGRVRSGRRVPAQLWVLSPRREFLAIVSDERFLAAQLDSGRRLALATQFAADSVRQRGTGR